MLLAPRCSPDDSHARLLLTAPYLPQLPGEFTRFDFPKDVPAPFNFLWAILTNQKMLTFPEKLQTAPPLVPMLLGGQECVLRCVPMPRARGSGLTLSLPAPQLH